MHYVTFSCARVVSGGTFAEVDHHFPGASVAYTVYSMLPRHG